MASSPLKRTIQTYDRIAPHYLDSWRNRSEINTDAQYFIDLIKANELADRPIIDVGCGPGFDASFLRSAGLNAIGLDFSIGMMQTGRSEFPGDFIQADMRKLPFNRSIGGLWVSASLLHLLRVDVPSTIAGFANVLFKGGILYLSVKQGSGHNWTQQSYGQSEPRYFTFWQPDTLDNVLENAGFEVLDGWTKPSISHPDVMWITRFAVR